MSFLRLLHKPHIDITINTSGVRLFECRDMDEQPSIRGLYIEWVDGYSIFIACKDPLFNNKQKITTVYVDLVNHMASTYTAV